MDEDNQTGQGSHGGSDADNSDTGIEAKIEAILNRRLVSIVNSAVTNQLKRKLKPKPEPEPDEDEADEDEEQQTTPRNRKANKPNETQKVMSRVKQLEDELRKSKEEQATLVRDAELRKLLEARGVQDPELVMPALKGHLTVEENRYVRVTDEGEMSVEDFLKTFLKGREYLLKPSGKNGGGPPATPAGRLPVAEPQNQDKPAFGAGALASRIDKTVAKALGS